MLERSIRMNKEFLNIVLYNPQIPPNTGNILRLCSNTRSKLHLIRPLGFDISDKSLKRAGLDYKVNYEIYDEFSDYTKLQDNTKKNFFITKFGDKNYSEQKFREGDSLIFGSEINGLPQSLLSKKKFTKLFIPMAKQSRSLNLSNAVAICLYEALRQNQFFNLKRFV